MALPGIVVLLAARAVLGPSVWIAMAIFGVLLSPGLLPPRLHHGHRRPLRAVRRRRPGRGPVSDLRIIGRHILSVVRAPIIIQSAIVAGIAIAIQAGLEFLGLGDLSIPTWGGMLQDGFSNI